MSTPATLPTNGAANGATNGAVNKDLPPPPPGQAPPQSRQDDKKEMMERLQPSKGAKATDAANIRDKGDRWVKDPTTGGQVYIKEPEFEGQFAYLH
jgi:hypothetical protein